MKVCSVAYLLSVSAGLLLSGAAAQGAATPAKSSATNSVAQPQAVVIPQSVFVIPSSPREGRNPFFPNSTFGQPVAKAKANPLDLASFVLNGITSPPRRTAMINGRTFEPGEEGEIKLAGGAHVRIKCLEITNESAVVLINGQRRELRLRFGL